MKVENKVRLRTILIAITTIISYIPLILLFVLGFTNNINIELRTFLLVFIAFLIKDIGNNITTNWLLDNYRDLFF